MRVPDSREHAQGVLDYRSPVGKEPLTAGSVVLAVIALLGGLVSGLLAAALLAGHFLAPNMQRIGLASTLFDFAILGAMATLAVKLGLELLRPKR